MHKKHMCFYFNWFIILELSEKIMHKKPKCFKGNSPALDQGCMRATGLRTKTIAIVVALCFLLSRHFFETQTVLR